jgi:hypothetical protein
MYNKIQKQANSLFLLKSVSLEEHTNITYICWLRFYVTTYRKCCQYVYTINTDATNIHIYLRVTRQIPYMEQELSTFSEHLSSPLVYNGVRVARSLVFCVVFCWSLFVLLPLFLWVIVVSVLLRFTVPDCPTT